jgi:hypothetical protein
MRHRLDATLPHSLVEFRVDPDVRGAHGFLSKVDDGLDGPRGTLFEGSAVDAFMEVDGVLPGNDVLQR